MVDEMKKRKFESHAGEPQARSRTPERDHQVRIGLLGLELHGTIFQLTPVLRLLDRSRMTKALDELGLDSDTIGRDGERLIPILNSRTGV